MASSPVIMFLPRPNKITRNKVPQESSTSLSVCLQCSSKKSHTGMTRDSGRQGSRGTIVNKDNRIPRIYMDIIDIVTDFLFLIIRRKDSYLKTRSWWCEVDDKLVLSWFSNVFTFLYEPNEKLSQKWHFDERQLRKTVHCSILPSHSSASLSYLFY